jgi:cyclic-di-GMP-binding protein
MPSFDIVCEMDRHEVKNAVDQANREVGNRFDFKGADAKFELKDEKITMKAEVDFQLQQMLEVLRNKLVKRSVDVGHLKVAEPVIQHKKAEQVITLQEGIAQDVAKKIVKFIKDAKVKVQATIQGEQVRVTGKKLDFLQEAIEMIKGHDFGLPLQCGNYRD